MNLKSGCARILQLVCIDMTHIQEKQRSDKRNSSQKKTMVFGKQFEKYNRKLRTRQVRYKSQVKYLQK